MTSSGAPRTLNNRPSHTLNVFWFPGWPVDILFITDLVVRNDSTHWSIVLWSGIAPSCATLNCRRKRRTVTTESFLKNCSTAKMRCSTFHCCMATELIPLHYSQVEWGGRRPSLSRLLPISKTYVLFAPPCMMAPKKKFYLPQMWWYRTHVWFPNFTETWRTNKQQTTVLKVSYKIFLLNLSLLFSHIHI